ncbi:putative transcriptional regulatory protein [Lachnellula occidentalis]|uniref:Putative transcriptional regulatory protein n=1 Tax=Lachnellula occidentalis TaxID=215460 RepID=A0A8H8UFI9_9HELO|nr:putative transcriptional regulatory protein [Lachnellula occidentalis]
MTTRKRVSQACRLCGKKKIKCDGVFPRCSTCQNQNEECSYGINKRRGPGRIRSETNGLMGTPQSLNASFPEISTPDSLHHTPAIPTHQSLRPLRSQDISVISSETSKRLFQTYFDCIHPIWPLLYKPLFNSSDYTYPSPRIPAALVLAIFAIASCVDNSSVANTENTTQESRKCPEPRVFFEEALEILQRGTKDDNARHPMNVFVPSITNCQVLVLLALQQHGVAEYSRAAVLGGVAAAMGTELRLHRAYELNDLVEREIRSRLWWNLYILDKMMSGEMGRPVILRAEETDTPWPSISESDEFELMSQQLHMPGAQARNNSTKMLTMSALHTTISLSMIMERIYRQIYGIAARKAIRGDQVAGDRLRMQLWAELQDWEKGVDASPLRLDLSDEMTSVPPTITNRVVMLTGTIMLHRPFIERWRPELNFAEPSSNPHDICLEAANRICVILERYLERLLGGPCDMVFTIFTAASILLHCSKRVEAAAAVDVRRRLQQCIHWLSVLGKSWKTAGTHHQLLHDLFDLPQALQEPNLAGIQVPTTNAGQQQALHSEGPLANLMNSITIPFPQAQPPSTLTHDWSFLRDFGDSTDQFYSWDVELRDLLDGGFAVDGGHDYV